MLEGEGRFPVQETASPEGLSLNLSLSDGRVALLKEIWPECRSAKGSFWGNLTLSSGSDGGLAGSGSFHLREGRIRARTYARRVDGLGVDLAFDGNAVRVDSARATVGKGTVELSGSVGVAPLNYDLRLRTTGARGVAVEVPQLSVAPGPILGRFSALRESLKSASRGEPRGDVTVRGLHGAHTVAGDLVLERTDFTYPPLPGSSGAAPRAWRNFWRSASYDLTLNSGKDTWYWNEYVNVRLDGRLRLGGRPGAWAVDGRMESGEGAINYLGQTFDVKRGVFEVATDTRPSLGAGMTVPYLSGEAEREVTGVDARGFATEDTITMIVDRAPLGEIQPRFVSRNNPNLKSDRVAMQALGLSGQDQISQAERDQLLRAGLIQLVGSGAATFANRLAQNFGIYMISAIYEPPVTPGAVADPALPSGAAGNTQGDLAAYLRGAGASARVRITDKLFGVYKVKLDEAQNQTFFRDEIELVYRLAGSVHVRASTELDSEQVLGQPPNRRAALENQWRFGLPRRRSPPGEEPLK
jgi:hypothetical protein